MQPSTKMSDIKLAFRESGAGEALVLLHGNGESSEYFTEQLRHFGKAYRVIAPDTRGHGNSPRGDGEFTLERFTEDLKDLFDDLNIKDAHLLGFSDGGNIALLFSLKYPSRVRSLILNGANLYPAGLKLHVRAQIYIQYALTSIMSVFSSAAEIRRELLALMTFEPRIDPKKLHKLTMPTAVIVGTHDVISDRHSRLIARSIPHAKYLEIDGDHYIASNNPESFNAAVDKFLNDIRVE